MVPVMQQIFVYGKETIPYSVLFSARRTLGIKVYPSGEVVLLAPEGTPEEVIEQKLHKRAPWILRQQAYFKDFGIRSPEKRYVSGESHYYLGKQFLLRVSEGKTNSVRYKGRCFEVICTSPDKARELMKSWYREHAKLKFAEYAEPIISRFARYGVAPTSLYVQEMENRWGSCTPKGKIILNTELILVPRTRKTQVCRVCGAYYFPICTVRGCSDFTLCSGDGKPLGQLHPQGENHSEYGTHQGAAPLH